MLIASGLILSFAVLGWSDDLESQPIHWAAILTSVGAIVAAVGVFFVWQSVREAERSRNETEKTRLAATAADISRRWDESEMRDSRKRIRSLYSEGKLANALVVGLSSDATEEELGTYTTIQMVPNYLEDAVILLGLSALDSDFVERSLGAVMRAQWDMMRDAANAYAEVAYRSHMADWDPWPNLRSYCGEAPWQPPQAT
ncbi:MAG TPA: hypothetical protein VGA11_02565 [Acidimicrobiia bacterium]